jgi:hypothetical protein
MLYGQQQSNGVRTVLAMSRHVLLLPAGSVTYMACARMIMYLASALCDKHRDNVPYTGGT